MKRMTKLLAALLALAMLCACLAACNQQPTPTNPSEPSQAPEGTKAPDAPTVSAEPVEFEYFGRISNPYPESSPVYDLLMEKTGVKINFTWAAKDAYQTILSARISEKDLPDVIGNVSDMAFMQTLIDDGLIVPLTDLLEEKMPNYYNLLTEEDKIWLTNPSDGEIYGFGFVHGMQAIQTWAVRQDWLDELKMEVPTTWEGWLELWRAIKATDLNHNGEADEIAVTYSPAANRFFKGVFGIQSNGTYSILDGEYIYDPEHPNYMEFLDAMRMLYEEGLIVQDYATAKAADLLAANRVGTFCDTVSTVTEYGRLLSETDQDALYVCITPVTGPHGDQMISQRDKLVQNIWITKAAIEEGKLDGILEFFNYCYSEEATQILNYGIEGESYEMVDGKPQLLSPYVDNFTNARSYGIVPQVFAFRFLPEVFMDISNGGMKEGDMDKYALESVRGNTSVNNEFFYPMHKSYVTEASTEYADLMAEQAALVDKYIMGEISRDEYLSTYQALKDAGLYEVIEQAKEIYDMASGK